ncbi:GntR family transcriptional regulator [Saccharopolyspora phatthalungensis]|uniref:GntR family transcriptional regulator n=1 Tax=Saccharopolyspora phatthalungensis TaxID=664693 RepID=A0A840Q0H8_9PSEU|nr:GntR family transcriptional regulator [Saccharopolyspora phatthalungensis]MBB5153021.1 GntR family transcriptional regulator [Saccharopolyspora phatthalungensis]
MTTKEEPPSRALATQLRAKIQRGDYAPGEKLPSERTLAAEYGIARNTAAEAVRLLAEEGLVTRQHGKGNFVRGEQALIRLGSDRYSPKYRESGLSPFLLECEKQGKVGRFEVLSVEKIRSPEWVADELGVENGSNVLERENVFWASDDPVYRVTTYVPWGIAKGSGLLRDEIPHKYGIHGIFEDKGYVMARIRESVKTRMPTPEEAEHLQLPSGVPVLEVVHTSLTAEQTAYEVTRFVMRGDMSGLLYNMPVE